MDIVSSARVEFDAGHSVPGLERCASAHGHHWAVIASMAGDLDPKTGWIRGSEGLPHALRKLADEFRGYDLNAMLPGVVTTPVGLAASFLDRLALRFPAISSVRVECSDMSAGEIRRTPRQ